MSARIFIGYGVAPCNGGWVPRLFVRNKERIEWRARGLDRDVAMAMAKSQAEDEAAHYVGDWTITVCPLEAA